MMRRCAFAGLLVINLMHARAEAAAVPPKESAPPGGFPFSQYDALLKRYTDAEGRVDYAALRQNDDATVDKLYASLAATGPDKTPDLYKGKDAALAYYLCAYNLLVWKNLLDHLPALKRVDESFYAFFRRPQFRVDGQEVNLDDLEKKIIRPRFHDGRVHFALNCASGGCPKLPRDAFAPDKVQAQLDREARRFINEPRNVAFDATSKRLNLSLIFKWYSDDFTADGASLLTYLNRYRAEGSKIPADAKLEYADYDWRLNDKSLPAR